MRKRKLAITLFAAAIIVAVGIMPVAGAGMLFEKYDAYASTNIPLLNYAMIMGTNDGVRYGSDKVKVTWYYLECFIHIDSFGIPVEFKGIPLGVLATSLENLKLKIWGTGFPTTTFSVFKDGDLDTTLIPEWIRSNIVIKINNYDLVDSNGNPIYETINVLYELFVGETVNYVVGIPIPVNVIASSASATLQVMADGWFVVTLLSSEWSIDFRSSTGCRQVPEIRPPPIIM